MFLSSFLEEDASAKSRVVPLSTTMDDFWSKEEEEEEEEDEEESNGDFQSHLPRKSSSFAYGDRNQRREDASSDSDSGSYDVESGGGSLKGMISTGPVSSTNTSTKEDYEELYVNMT